MPNPFITRALELNGDGVQQSEQYMKYIATRPRVERLGSHGLFGDEDSVDLDKIVAELENYTAMCGRTSSPSSGRMLPGWATIARGHGEISCGHTATTLPPP